MIGLRPAAAVVRFANSYFFTTDTEKARTPLLCFPPAARFWAKPKKPQMPQKIFNTQHSMFSPVVGVQKKRLAAVWFSTNGENKFPLSSPTNCLATSHDLVSRNIDHSFIIEGNRIDSISQQCLLQGTLRIAKTQHPLLAHKAGRNVAGKRKYNTEDTEKARTPLLCVPPTANFKPETSNFYS